MGTQVLTQLAFALIFSTTSALSGLQFLDIQETLRQAQMTARERAAIAQAIVDQLRPAMSRMRIGSEDQLTEVALDARVMMVDLNGDGVSEVVTQGSGKYCCSPTGNCAFWIFEKAPSGYTLLLQRGAVQRFAIAPQRTQGFYDIVVAMHGSATESTLRVFKYNHGHYGVAACYNEAWSVLEGDTVRELKEPQVTPCRRPQ